MTPIEILTKELNDHQKALDKSKLCYRTGKISRELHWKHKNNLLPLIKQYKQAIKKLK